MSSENTAQSVPSTSQTEVVEHSDGAESEGVIKLKLTKSKNKEKDEKKVGWTEETVDNEHMGKKKSKCCCIYKKPTVFGESSSESDDECENCFGHPEVRKKNRHRHNHNGDNGESGPDDSNGKPEPDDTNGNDSNHSEFYYRFLCLSFKEY